MMQRCPEDEKSPVVAPVRLFNVAARGLTDNNYDEEIKHGPTLPESASRLPDVRKFDNKLKYKVVPCQY